MKPSYFEETITKLYVKKEELLQQLIQMSCNELIEMRKYYWDLYMNAFENNYKEASEVHYKKYLIIDEAIEVKMGNEEPV